MKGYNKAAEALRAEIRTEILHTGITRKIMENSEQVMNNSKQDAIKAEIRVTKRAKALRFLIGPYRLGLNASWRLLIWITCMSAWLLLPCIGVLFAGAFAETIDTSTDLGQFSVIAVYIVGIIAGCKVAHEAGANIKQQYGGLKW